MVLKIVVRYADGRILKGTSSDFFPNKLVFHLKDNETGINRQINVDDLKAIFFVKSFDGNRDYQEKCDVVRIGLGKQIKVEFNDGETIIGYTQGFSPARPSFIVFPSDPDSNNQRVFVVTAATKNVSFVQ